MVYFNLISCFVMLIGSSILSGVRGGSDHKRLLDHLLNNYNILERPVHNENDTVQVKIGLTLMSIVELNIARDYLESSMWLNLQWYDVNLKWNASEYGGIKSLNIPLNRIWKPDIHLYNSVHPEFEAAYETLALVSSDGKCMHVPPGLRITTCTIDVTYYPFDVQSCGFKFGSWTTDGDKINLNLDNETQSADLTSFLPNSEWEIIEFPAVADKTYYQCCPEPYVSAIFTLKVKRRGEQIFSGCTFALVVGAISTMLSLLFPLSSGHRITLGMVTVLTMYVIGNWISTNLGGKTSKMVYFFFNMAILNLFSVILNSLLISVYTRNPTIHRIPTLLRRIIFDYISPFLLLKRPTSHDIPASHITNTDAITENRDQYEEFVSDLEALVQKMKGQKTQAVVGFNDWQFIGIILDRLVFAFYIITFFCFFISYFSTFS